jgi:hypothetical protein
MSLPPKNFDLLASVIGKSKPKPPEQIAAEAEAEAARLDAAAARLDANAKYKENPNGMELTTLKANTTTGVGGRRRKSRRGKSRKYKRTLKRRKNKTKNRK